MARRQNYVLQPCEGNVVSGQSKVEKAKYVHSENNLRNTLVNISESFKRSSKKINEETETLQNEMKSLRRSVEKVRQEKERRMAGECCSNRRPHRAERLLFDENIVKLQPFSETNQSFVYKSRHGKAKERYLKPIRLRKTKSTHIDTGPPGENKEHIKFPYVLPGILTNPTTELQKMPTKNGGCTESKILRKSWAKLKSTRNVAITKPIFVPTCDVVDIEATRDSFNVTKLRYKQNTLPPLEKIPETLEPKTYSSPHGKKKNRSCFEESPVE